MERQLRPLARRAIRPIAGGLLLAQILAGALVLLLTRNGSAPEVAAQIERVLAYGWVALTIAGAVGAYGLASAAASATSERRRTGGAIAAAAIADFVAYAGILVFFFVGAWPMLVVAQLVGLMGLVFAWPAGSGDATLDESPPLNAGV